MLKIQRKLTDKDKPGERITMFVAGHQIDMEFDKVHGNRIQVGIQAPQAVRIVRTELIEREAAA